eukprot:1428953-Pleurochrysis_carterae.AAC.2
MSDLLEARYAQAEVNLNALAKAIRERGGETDALDALLGKLEADLKHSVLRATAASLSTSQRLEERLAILQRAFSALVRLMEGGQVEEPVSPESPFSLHPWHSRSTYPAPYSPSTSSDASGPAAFRKKNGGHAEAPARAASGAATASAAAGERAALERVAALEAELRSERSARAAAQQQAEAARAQAEAAERQHAHVEQANHSPCCRS